MKTKTATDRTCAFNRKTTKIFPETAWSDKGTAFKGEHKEFSDSKNVELYNTPIETKSAFAERNFLTEKYNF